MFPLCLYGRHSCPLRLTLDKKDGTLYVSDPHFDLSSSATLNLMGD